MSSNLVILESPGKIGAVKSYLGSNYKVIASVGHIRDLPKSTLGIDIENGFAPHYINIRGKGDIIKELRKEAKNADKIFFATDPDREGEAISWHLASVLGDDAKKAKRVTFNEITKSAVKEAIKHPRSIDMNLVNAQQARRILDRIVGYKISPFLWKTIKSGLSAGRVQSVATKIITEREEEIKSFIPEEYWTITAELTLNDKRVVAHYFGSDGNRVKVTSGEQANIILKEVKENGSFKVIDVKKSLKRKAPQPPFITSTLQQEASRKLNFQSQKTMKVAQELYEGINLGSDFGGVQGLITYMRTDSLRVSQEAQVQAREFIEKRYGTEYRPEKVRNFKSKSNSQDAHEAIRPSKVSLEPMQIKKHLTNDQFKLYKLIWDRFLASQMSSAVYDTVIADIEKNKHIFRVSGHTVKFLGYTAIYVESNDTLNLEDDQFNPEKNENHLNISLNEEYALVEVGSSQHFTEPPPRYDEASLIKFLEEKGIGRPSTYTPIITVILSRGYVERDGKSLKPTPLGEVITKVMNEHFPDVVNYKFTANMENALDTIANGSVTLENVLSRFYKGFEKELEAASVKLENSSVEIPVEETNIICENCGATMIIKNGRFGKFAACPNYPKCKNTKTLDKDGKIQDSKKPEITDEKCELCGAGMVLRHGRYGDFYACSNYPKCKNTKTKEGKTDVSCPECGAEIIIKTARSKKQFYSCSRYPDCSFSTWDTPTHEKCPKCSGMLLEKKTKMKNYLYCSNKNCSYKSSDKDEKN